jgi:hypothetical protein
MNTNTDMRFLPEMNNRLIDRARRAAARVGWRVHKARGYPHHDNRGGLMLVNENNVVIDGDNYDLTPMRVIELCRKAEVEHGLEQVRARLRANGYHTFRRGPNKFWLIRAVELTADELCQRCGTIEAVKRDYGSSNLPTTVHS